MPPIHDWRQPPSPTPPPESNGWGRHVAGTLEHILVRLHYLERSHEELRSAVSHPSDAPNADHHSGKDTWAERRDTAKEIATALRWLAGIVLVVLLASKKLQIEDLRTLGKLLGGGA